MTQQFEDTAQAKINRGQRSRHLLDDPVLQEAFDAILAEADMARDQSDPADVELREQCHRAKKSIEALRKRLASWVSDGTIEQMHLDELNAKEKQQNVN